MKAGLDTLVLRLTNRCNLSCAYCYAEGEPAGADLPPELAVKAVSLACPPGGSLHIQFTGGEPLLCWDSAAQVLSLTVSTISQTILAVRFTNISARHALPSLCITLTI